MEAPTRRNPGFEQPIRWFRQQPASTNAPIYSSGPDFGRQASMHQTEYSAIKHRKGSR
jgi:hypothetical protein